MDLIVYDDEDRRYLPAYLAVLLAVVMIVVGAGAALVLRPEPQATVIGGSPDPQAATLPEDAGEAPACVDDALRRADALLEQSRRLSGSLADDTVLLNRLRVGLTTTPDAVDQTVEALGRSCPERERLMDEAAAYEQARSDCPS